MHGLEEGRQERKREKKKGAIPEVSEKGPKNQTSTPKSVEKGCQNRPKSCKNRPKRGYPIGFGGQKWGTPSAPGSNISKKIGSKKQRNKNHQGLN